MRSAVVVALLAVAPSASAEPEEQASAIRPRPPSREPVPPTSHPVPEHHEPSAADVADAPVPGRESGRSDPVDPGDSAARELGRGLLFLPRLAVDGVLFPIRSGVWALDRYHLVDQYTRIFFNDAETIGLYPTIVIDSSLGVFAGAQFVHRDLLGEHEHLIAQVAWGNRFRQIYSAGFKSGDRFGDRFHIEVDTAYERRPHDTFYGIGNGDQMPPPATPIDPLVDATSVEAKYRQDRARVAMVADLRMASQLHLRAAGAASQVRFGRADQSEPIDQIYDPAGLAGWNGVRYGYGELALRWDSRRGGRALEPFAVYSAGSLADVYGGRMHRLDRGPDFSRYGVDLQHFLRLGAGPRVLAAHFHGEGVTGRREDVPFSELPMLGGPTYLRGYPLDRFRDRVAAFGSLQYQWDLSQWVSANAFVDAGRVFPSLRELSLDGLRVGYGVGLEAHSQKSFLIQTTVATSIDGGVQFDVSFNRIFDLGERVRRK